MVIRMKRILREWINGFYELPDLFLTVVFIGCETAVLMLLAALILPFLPFSSAAELAENFGNAAVKILAADTLISAAIGLLHIFMPNERE